MEIASLEFKDLVISIAEIQAMFSNEKRLTAFLNKTIKEMPIINEILKQINLIKSFPEGSLKEKTFTVVQRDLIILLALRQLEKAKTTVYN